MGMVLILIPVMILFIFLTGKPLLVLGGFCFAGVCYYVFWSNLPPEKRSGWGYKKCETAVPADPYVTPSTSSNYDIHEEYCNNPAYRSMGDNIYHGDD